MRAFPISNWTELDVWKYIKRESLQTVPLYFSNNRPTVTRGGKIIVVNDSRFILNSDETPVGRRVRFRSLGCYPLSAAEETSAETVEEIIQELEKTRSSERAGRLIDEDNASSMERRKVEGYF